ncbi:MAG: hypothetical protein JWQ94_1916 [Tardiphaga sp.]|nr:hypothetical protein [Tardiphaga sp.]
MDQVNVTLAMIGNPDLGVSIQYSKWDGRVRKRFDYFPRGDLSRVLEFVESLHETPLSVGLFIAFRKAWLVVKEFMEKDGALPTSIEWIAAPDLAPEAFPTSVPPGRRSTA